MTFESSEPLAREVMRNFEIPGLTMLVARGGAPAESWYSGTDSAGIPVGLMSLWVVASLTKLGTALCILRLADEGALGLDDPLERHAPDAAAAEGGVTLRELLCHTSGLPLDLPDADALYGTPVNWDELARRCLSVPLENPPRTRVHYGNVGYGLLAIVVERVTGEPFARALATLVLGPLGIEGYLGGEPPRPPVRLADVHSRHAGTEIEPFNSRYYRALGLPWSGLVTTAEGALALVRAYAGHPSGFLSPTLLTEATSNQTDSLPGGYGGRFDYERAPWGLGVDIKGDKKPHWTPANASPRTYGHAGATGCAAWHDPAVDTSWAILGARTADNAWLVRGGARIAATFLGS